MINLVLSGDNAVLIAMASRNLPARQQKLAIFWGSAGAVAFRILLTVVIVYLLRIPFLQAVGGLLLIYIAAKLLNNKDCREECKAAGSLLEAIKTVIIADLIMSLDNTLAIAAVSRGHWILIVIGLAISVPIIIFCSRLIIYLMKKFPIIIYIGAGILAWTAGEMLVGDPKVSLWLEGRLSSLAHLGIPILITLLVIVTGLLANLRNNKKLKEKKA
jgi:YjbE family integral membrane protein